MLFRSKLVQEISAASNEQNAGTDQINVALQQLNLVTQQNAASSEELATSSEELSSQADQLKDLISFFKVGESSNFAFHKTTHKPIPQNKATIIPEKKITTQHIIKPSPTKTSGKGINLKMKSDESEYENF
mgnify:FL=1